MQPMRITISIAQLVGSQLIARVQAVSSSAVIHLDIRTQAEPDADPQELAYDIALRHLDPA